MTTTMIRTAKLALALALPALLAAGSGTKSPTADPLPVGSVWVGTGEDVDAKGERRPWGCVAVHVHHRKEKFFEGTAWYPGANNGVSRLSGVLDGEGGISLHEPSIVFAGTPSKQWGALASGGTYTGRLDAKSVNLSGSYVDPKSGVEVQTSLSLLRAPASEIKATTTKPK